MSKVNSFPGGKSTLVAPIDRRMTVKRKNIMAGTFLAFYVTAGAAVDFTGRRYEIAADVAVGSMLNCIYAPGPKWMQDRAPQAYSWAKSKGLVEESAVTGTLGFSAKVTSSNGGDRALFLGCWVTTDIVSESVNGTTMMYAKASFKMNDAVRASPLADLVLCRKTKKRPAVYMYAQGDYSVYYPDAPIKCERDGEKVTLPEAERHTVFFQLKQSLDKKSYQVARMW